MSSRHRHHIRQGRPDRRFRRLIPAVAATAALAAGLPAKPVSQPRPALRPASRQQAVVPRPLRDAAAGRTSPSA